MQKHSPLLAQNTINNDTQLANEEAAKNNQPTTGSSDRNTKAFASGENLLSPRLVSYFDKLYSNGSALRPLHPINLSKVQGVKLESYEALSRPNEKRGSYKNEGRYVNDMLTVGYYLLWEQANTYKQDIMMATVTFTDEFSSRLRNLRSKSIASRVTKKVKELGWDRDGIIVIEECEKSIVRGTGKKRLHLHLITRLDNGEKEALKQLLAPISMQTSVQDTWKFEMPYSEYHSEQEEDFGLLPTEQEYNAHKEYPSSNYNDYWLNQYRHGDKVITILPVDLGSVDYLAKALNKPLEKGRANYSFIGLNGRTVKRIEMYKQGQSIKKQAAHDNKAAKAQIDKDKLSERSLLDARSLTRSKLIKRREALKKAKS